MRVPPYLLGNHSILPVALTNRRDDNATSCAPVSSLYPWHWGLRTPYTQHSCHYEPPANPRRQHEARNARVPYIHTVSPRASLSASFVTAGASCRGATWSTRSHASAIFASRNL
jgi:hypothetical protein